MSPVRERFGDMLHDDDRDLMRAVSDYLRHVNELSARETVLARTRLFAVEGVGVRAALAG